MISKEVAMQAAQELLRRKQAQEKLIDFVKYTFPKYQTAPHHLEIIEKLEAVERGEIKRLAIFMPPRHGKSELASRRFPAWYLGRNHGKNIIATSYNDDKAREFGEEVRDIVKDDLYKNVFSDVIIRKDVSSKGRWKVENYNSQYKAAGVRTSVTGSGADLLIIDDPVKDWEEADSELKREKVYDWYKSTAYTRLEKGAAIILIQTRWHEDDLAGRILSNSKEDWIVINYPAVDNDGNSLWPEKYDKEYMESLKHEVGARVWNALYMQNPTPDDGTYFLKDMIRYYNELPKRLRYYITSDYATKDSDGDYTVHSVWGIDDNENIYLVDYWRKQSTSDLWIDAFLDLVNKYKPELCFGEAGVIFNSIQPALKKRMKERNIYTMIKLIQSSKAKEVRARSIQARASVDGLYFSSVDATHDDFISEMLKFPNGKHDDMVDTLSLLGMAINLMIKPAKEKTRKIIDEPQGVLIGSKHKVLTD